ncbi:MAG: hypothetical protein ACPF98_08175 [Prochlorococcaceae cyanobacterium]
MLEQLLEQLPAGALLRLDANGGWDRATAGRWAMRLQHEQAAMARATLAAQRPCRLAGPRPPAAGGPRRITAALQRPPQRMERLAGPQTCFGR